MDKKAKKKTIYIISTIILVSLVVGFIIVNSEYFLFRSKNYKVYNEKGERLPILLFDRANNHEYGKNDSPVIKEILLYIEDKINMRHGGFNDGVLSIDLKTSEIMYPNGGRNIFTKLGTKIIFQHSTYMTDEFRYLYNNDFNYKNKEDEPIQFFIAEGNTYKFNTFGGLKAYGDTVIVKKLDGPVEKEGKYIAGE